MAGGVGDICRFIMSADQSQIFGHYRYMQRLGGYADSYTSMYKKRSGWGSEPCSDQPVTYYCESCLLIMNTIG